MRFVALFLLAPACFAAPVPKAPSLPGVTITLAGDTSIMTLTIRNDGRDTLEVPYKASPWEPFTVVLRGGNGKTYTFRVDGKDDPKGVSGTFTVPAGKSETFSLHVCHFMPLLENPEKVTATAQLKVGEKIVDAKPFSLTP